MLTWDDIRAIDAIADPLGVVSIYTDRPEETTLTQLWPGCPVL